MTILKTILTSAAVALATALAAPAEATVPVSSNNCGSSLSLATPDAIACAGYYGKNIIDGEAPDITAQQNAVAALGGTWDGNFQTLNKIEALTNGNQLNFGQMLSGLTIIGLHFGNITDDVVNPKGNGNLGNLTVFWKFDFTIPTDHIILDDTRGFSNAALYSTQPTGAVPEPATWAMMILGFGAAGIGLRRTRRTPRLVSQLA